MGGVKLLGMMEGNTLEGLKMISSMVEENIPIGMVGCIMVSLRMV